MNKELRILDTKLDCAVRLLLSLHTKLDRIERKQEQEMGLVEDLGTQVNRVETVSGSVSELLARMTAKLQELINAGNPAALQDYVTRLAASNDKLAADVVANTPAE